MSIYKNILDGFKWSFSRLTAYEHCPYNWYVKYIEMKDGAGSYYAENGSAMHEVFDLLAKGKIDFTEAPNEYLERYNTISSYVKQDIMDRTFDACLSYLCSIPEDILDEYEIIASELKVNFKVGDFSFIGFIDLLLRDKNGDLIIVDHKSAEPFLKKDGKPYAKAKEIYRDYVRQQSLYSIAVKDIFGKYPTKIVFHHFKNDGALTVIPFDEKNVKEATEWALSVIDKIYNDEAFEPLIKTGFCYRLCDYRGECSYPYEEEDEEI